MIPPLPFTAAENEWRTKKTLSPWEQSLCKIESLGWLWKGSRKIKGIGSVPFCPDVLKLTWIKLELLVSAIVLNWTFIISTSGSYLLRLAVRLLFFYDVNLVLNCKHIYIESITRYIIAAFELKVSWCCTAEMSDWKSALFKLSWLQFQISMLLLFSLFFIWLGIQLMEFIN